MKTLHIINKGDENDKVVELVASTEDTGIIEVGYYAGESKPKNIIAISTQVGCPAQCSFCEFGKSTFKRNLTAAEMIEQAYTMLKVLKDAEIETSAKPLKVHFTKSGDPLLNPHVLEAIYQLQHLAQSYKFSTIFPKSAKAMNHFKALTKLSVQIESVLQVQISLISTCQKFREKMAGKLAAPFVTIRKALDYWSDINPSGRKPNMSLIIAESTPIDVHQVKEIFPPHLVNFRFRPCVETQNAKDHHLEIVKHQKLRKIKEAFRAEGYTVNDWATPTATERKFSLAAGVTRRRYLQAINTR